MVAFASSLRATKEYVPERGDLVWIDFNPTVGHEQKGKRPALVISKKGYNEKTGLMITCPVTSAVKRYPFEVVLNEAKVKGCVLADQVRAMDWRTRKVTFIQKSRPSLVIGVQNILKEII